MSSGRTALEGLLEVSPAVLEHRDQSAGASRFAHHHSEPLFGCWCGDLVGQPMAALATGYLRSVYPEHAYVNSAEPQVRPTGRGLGPQDHQQGCSELPSAVSPAHQDTGDVLS
jgi:hypothetical protein